jgi:hypothetical protein
MVSFQSFTSIPAEDGFGLYGAYRRSAAGHDTERQNRLRTDDFDPHI